MVLTSFSYLVFLAVALAAYYACPKRWQYVCLLVEGIVFYCLSATPWTVVYLLGQTGVSYLAVCINDRMVRGAGKGTGHAAGSAVPNGGEAADERTAQRRIRIGRAAVVTGVISNIACLVLLKYLNLFIGTANSLAGLFSIETGWGTVNWVASLGLSFYTLQLIGYILDCYWGTVEPERSFRKMALFACYFPQLTSGPIVRFEEVKDQLYAPHKAEYRRIVYGLWRILWGFFKKIVIANSLITMVRIVYTMAYIYSGPNIWFGTAAFCIQLYADFSGCMDIILGTSECFGIDLPENFQSPFFSRTIQEFWRRWHITLGAWLRDYIMNPILKSDFSYNLKQRSMKLLGKKRGKKIHVYAAMFVLWMAMGLWHGSSWKYAIGEGLWFWLLIVFGECLAPVGKRLVQLLHIPVESVGWHLFESVRTFLCFMVGMVFFRADTTAVAWQMIKFSFTNWKSGISILAFLLPGTKVILVIALLVLFWVDFLQYKGIAVRDMMSGLPVAVRWSILYGMGILIMLQAVSQIGIDTGTFIYGQF